MSAHSSLIVSSQTASLERLRGGSNADSSLLAPRDGDVRIEVQAGRERGIEIPRTFRLNGNQIMVVEVCDQWYGPDYRCCKVKGSDGALYILRLDDNRSEWHLTMFASAQAQGLSAHPRGRPRGIQ